MKLFRDEVTNVRREKLAGDAALAVPISWQIIGYLFLVILVVGTVFLATSNYSRIETASGAIALDKGVSEIFPANTGTIAEIFVSDGERVEAGDILAQIRTEQDSRKDVTAAGEVARALASQDASLAFQIEASNAAASAQLNQVSAQEAGLRQEITQIRSQIEMQRSLIDSAQADLDRAVEVAERGFISARDLQVREEALISRHQVLSQLNQSLATKQAALEETRRTASQIVAQSRANEASLSAARALVGQQAASTSGSRSYAIRAPISGTVSALFGRTGQVANSQQPLMSIIPEGAELQAELLVPSSAIGFVEIGQEVRLAIDTFAYQRFGTVKGTIITVAESAVSRPEANGGTMSVYPVRIALDVNSVSAFGRNERLTSGMTLSAQIVTARQTLLEWLFEPLYAVGR